MAQNNMADLGLTWHGMAKLGPAHTVWVGMAWHSMAELSRTCTAWFAWHSLAWVPSPRAPPRGELCPLQAPQGQDSATLRRTWPTQHPPRGHCPYPTCFPVVPWLCAQPMLTLSSASCCCTMSRSPPTRNSSATRSSPASSHSSSLCRAQAPWARWAQPSAHPAPPSP